MKVEGFVTPYMQSVCYLLTENGHGVLVDPCDTPEVKAALRGVTLDYALLTHEHCDHIFGADWARAQGAKVVCTAACAKNIGDPRMNYSRYYDALSAVQERLCIDPSVVMEPFTRQADMTFEDTATLPWQGIDLCLTATPGHAQGEMCILAQDALFTGDTLLWGEKTVTRFLGGSKRALLARTIPYLQGLDPKTNAYPGHFEPFVLGARLAYDII